MYKEHLILILDKSAYFYIFETNDVLDYYNYLAQVYKELESYKSTGLNYIEYIINEEEVKDMLSKERKTKVDLRNDLNLLLKIRFKDYMPLDRHFPKIPDYMIKHKAHLYLPLGFYTKNVKQSKIFETINLNEELMKELKNVIVKHCFLDKSLTKYKEFIVKGQSIEIAEHMTSFNTYFDTDYDLLFDKYLESKIPPKIQDSKYDDLFILEKENLVFTAKLLNVHFEGSFYEYRNFLFTNQHILLSVAKIIENHFKKIYNDSSFMVRPLLDRFIIYSKLDEGYTRLINTYTHICLYKDIEKNINFLIPTDLEQINIRDLKMKDNHFLLSNFTEEGTKELINKKEKQSKSKNKTKSTSELTKKNIELERLRKIHEEKFPDIPFFLDKNDDD